MMFKTFDRISFFHMLDVSPKWVVENFEPHLFFVFFQWQPCLRHSSTKLRYVERITNGYSVDKFPEQSSGSLQLLQSQCGLPASLIKALRAWPVTFILVLFPVYA
ncbi:hypothetical protein AMECASPLE_008099 [Ameca splendens]|uniref:Uncharacterized protein n=1 Tax=Ameca splendens TaxID=208324 RepID=A0ABV0XZT8_9TELE